MKKYILSIAGIIAVMAVVFSVQQAHANPSFFATGAQTAAATTSPAFMQAATASTTVAIYDSYSSGATTQAQGAALLMRLSATTTAAIFNVTYEFSQGVAGVDCITQPTFCEWYADNYTQSSTGYPVQTVLYENIKVISVASTGTTTKAFFLPTPTRYVRVLAKLTGAPGNVWAQIVPGKERSE